MSFLSYLILISLSISSFLSIPVCLSIGMVIFLYVSADPNPYMAETEATIITSLLFIRAAVAACLNFSISSLIEESFSIYVSVVTI